MYNPRLIQFMQILKKKSNKWCQNNIHEFMILNHILSLDEGSEFVEASPEFSMENRFWVGFHLLPNFSPCFDLRNIVKSENFRRKS